MPTKEIVHDIFMVCDSFSGTYRCWAGHFCSMEDSCSSQKTSDRDEYFDSSAKADRAYLPWNLVATTCIDLDKK